MKGPIDMANETQDNRFEVGTEVMLAQSLIGISNTNDGFYARVGANHVTEITITNDGRGNAGLYSRAMVWSDDKLVSEHPVHNLESVYY